MLDPWIIEEILRREEEQRRQDERGRYLELPLESPRYHETDPRPAAPVESERGVVVIDI